MSLRDQQDAASRFLDREYVIDVRSLALVRIATASWLLFSGVSTRTHEVATLPVAMWDPPLGPLRLLEKPPPQWLLLILGWVITAALVALLLGVFSEVAGVVAGIGILAAEGIENSFSKIDHGFLLIALFVVLMSWSGWDRAMKIGSDRHGRSEGGHQGVGWPVALTMLALSVMMAMAALPKITSGWLDPQFSATRIRHLRGVVGLAKERYLADDAMDIDFAALWEAADWFAVIFESAFIFAVWRRPTFRLVLAAAAVFHLCVLLLLNISFTPHLFVYAVAFDWTEAGARVEAFQRRHPAAAGGSLVAVSLSLAWLGRAGWLDVRSVSTLILFVGGAAGAAYLARQAAGALQSRASSGSVDPERSPST